MPSDASLNAVGKVGPVLMVPNSGDHTIAVTITVNGATVVLEHIVERTQTEGGSWSTDATYNTNQAKTAVTGTAGSAYRLRCTTAPTAGLDCPTRLEIQL